MLVANHRRHAHLTFPTPSHSRPTATGSPHRRLPISAFLRSLSAPPRSRPEQPRLCAHHPKQPLLCALLTPFPRSPLAFPQIHAILPASPGPPSLAARLWRSFDGGVGKERTSKAIASPRAQERTEPVACRQKSSRLSLNPHPTRGSPARSFEPHSKVCQEIRSKRFGVGRELPQSMPERSIAKGQLPPKEQQGSRRGEHNRSRCVSSPVSHAGSMEVSGLPQGQPQDRAARPRVP
jgi:hypothetical protein